MQDEPYFISADPGLLDPEAIHAYLTRSYWASGISLTTVRRAMAHSLCFGLYKRGAEPGDVTPSQIGFARVVTDKTSFAYLADVYVLEGHRGQGLSKRLVAAVQSHPDLQHLRRFLLATRDAHGLYAQFGFKPLAHPERMMEVSNPDAHLLR